MQTSFRQRPPWQAALLLAIALFAAPAFAAPAAWAPNTQYALNAQVTYNTIVYQCRQAHRSQTGWEPPNSYALWMRPTPTTVDAWTVQTNYVVGTKVVHQGVPYKCTSAHVSQPDWAPNVATTLWSKLPVVASCSGQADGTFCNDSSKCTNIDQCKAGACVGAPSVTCPASLPCQVNACAPSTGQCTITNIAAGTSCGKLQFCDGAGSCQTPKVFGMATDPSVNEPPAGGDVTCQGGVSLGTLGKNAQGEDAWSSVSYVDNQPPTPPATCREQLHFCDANNVEITRVPESDLNAPAAQSDSCPAVAAPDPALCGLDPNTIGATCAKDSDCGAGFVCGVMCTDPVCRKGVERHCGKVRSDCGGIPADPQFCDPRVFRLCPDPDAVGTVTEDQAAAQLPNQTAPQPTAEIPPAEQLQIEPFQSAAAGVCAAEAVVEKEQKQSQPPPGQSMAKVLTLGNSKWGVFLTPSFLQGMKVNFSGDPLNEDFQVDTSAGLDAGGFVLGHKVTALTLSAVGVAKQCGANAGLVVKIFGDRIASADLIQGVQAGFGPLSLTDDGVANNKDDAQKCQDKLTTSINSAGTIRRAMFAARNLEAFYKANGVTKDVCLRSNKFLNLGLDCNDPNSYKNNQEIINSWKAEYGKKTEEYLKAKTDLTVAKDKISASARWSLVNYSEPFANIKILETTIPIFGVPVTLAVDMMGNITYKGTLELGTSYAADKPRSDVPGLGPFLSGTDASLRIVTGFTEAPGANLNLLVFAGVGFSAVSIGVEGKIKLLSIDWPVDVRLATVRKFLADTRDVQSSDFKGDAIPGMPANTSNWKFGYSWGAKLTLGALDGQVDVAVRIKLLFAKKTIRWRLFDWKGFTKEFQLAGSSDKSSLMGFSGFGDYAPKIAYRTSHALTVADVPAANNDDAVYTDRLGDEPCGVIIQ